MNLQSKNILDNPHTVKHGVTYDQIYNVIEPMKLGEYLKIEYTKIPSRQSEADLIESVEDEINQMTIQQFNEGYHNNLLTHLLKEHKGELKTVYYQRAESFRNAGGYLLFKGEDENWKSVDIRNIISITNIDGVQRKRSGK